MIKDEAEEITSASGKHIKTASINDFKIVPLVDQSTAKRMQIIGTILQTLFATSLIITFVLALFFKGSLLTIWLCINTVQLLAHVPPIQAKLPANAHYFFLNLMCMVRLNFASFNDSVYDLVSTIEESKLIHDEDAYFSSQLHNFGYRFSFIHNMFLIACAALLLTLVWAFTTILDRLRPSASSTMAKASLNNCMVRFALEAHLELMICAFITLSNTREAGSIYWLISLASVIASTITIVVLVYRTFNMENLSNKISSKAVELKERADKVDNEVAEASWTPAADISANSVYNSNAAFN